MSPRTVWGVKKERASLARHVAAQPHGPPAHGAHGVEHAALRALCGAQAAQAQHFYSTSQDRASHYPILGNGRSAKLGWQMQDYHPQGAVGNAAAATAQKGQLVIDAAAQQLALLLQEISQLPLTTLQDR